MAEVSELAKLAKPATVFVLAQNRLLRETVTRVLDKKGDIVVLGVHPFSPLATEQIIEAAPDILLADSVTMNPTHEGFIREVRQHISRITIVMFAMDEDQQAFLRAVEVGALGYVLSDTSAEDFVDAVRTVAAGEAACPHQLCTSLFRYVARQRTNYPVFK